jgi:hypothetical protein
VGEVGASPQTPPRKLFSKSFLGTFKNFYQGWKGYEKLSEVFF